MRGGGSFSFALGRGGRGGGEVEVIGLVEVVEGGGERGSAGKVEKGGVVGVDEVDVRGHWELVT